MDIALVLHGGGFAGAKQVGFAKELWARGKIPKVIQVVSVGALNGAGLVEVGPEEVELRWRLIERRGPSSIFNWKGIPFHIFSNALLSDYGLNDLVNQLDMNKIIASPIRLEVAVRNETAGKLMFFSNHDLDIKENPEILRKAIKASASLPGVFPPVEINGEYYSDAYCFDLERLSNLETILLLMNDVPRATKDLHSWPSYQRLFVGFNEILDDLIELKIDSFVDKHPEFKRIKINSNLGIFDRIKKKLADAASKILEALDLKDSRQLIVVSPEYSIPTLRLDTFHPPSKNLEGDISKAIRLSQEQAKQLLDQLEI